MVNQEIYFFESSDSIDNLFGIFFRDEVPKKRSVRGNEFEPFHRWIRRCECEFGLFVICMFLLTFSFLFVENGDGFPRFVIGLWCVHLS